MTPEISYNVFAYLLLLAAQKIFPSKILGNRAYGIKMSLDMYDFCSSRRNVAEES